MDHETAASGIRNFAEQVKPRLDARFAARESKEFVAVSSV